MSTAPEVPETVEGIGTSAASSAAIVTQVAMDRVIEQFRRLGMSGYEAKAYVALTSAGQPLNGYEVAKRSGVPRSTVYETLGKLVERGAVFEVRGATDSTEYLPLPSSSLLARLRRDFEESVGILETELPSLSTPMDAHLVHNLTGPSALIDRSIDLVAAARNDLFVSVWPDQLADLKPHMRTADQRGVDISVITYGIDADPVGHTYSHRFSAPEIVLANVGCKLLVVAADREQAVIGGFIGAEGWGIYTEDPAVILVAVEYVRHDIAMQLVIDRVGEEQVQHFWSTDPDLVRLRSDRGAPGLAIAHQRSGAASANGAPAPARTTARSRPRRS